MYVLERTIRREQLSEEVNALALSRRSAHGDESVRRGVRAAAASPPFPLGEVLASTTSAEGKPSLFGRFSGTITPSDFSSACMLIVRLLP